MPLAAQPLATYTVTVHTPTGDASAKYTVGKPSPHMFRLSYATELLERGVDIRDIRDLLLTELVEE